MPLIVEVTYKLVHHRVLHIRGITIILAHQNQSIIISQLKKEKLNLRMINPFIFHRDKDKVLSIQYLQVTIFLETKRMYQF
ncbi:unnamed protein product [Paramecium sonneborni]|uniref:Uncharacterized protein n=1 Tax=Paramecium sonneborni TaxID=65129 RepID=A0A8S1NTA6_9CILI|nr:unnamed protein product [Paramecium sonneborni]